MFKANNKFWTRKKRLKVILATNNEKIKSLIYSYLTTKKPLPCVVETFGHRMYCIYWPVMTQVKK